MAGIFCGVVSFKNTGIITESEDEGKVFSEGKMAGGRFSSQPCRARSCLVGSAYADLPAMNPG